MTTSLTTTKSLTTSKSLTTTKCLTTRWMTRLVAVVLLGAALSGCTRCGWVWDDWNSQPKSCRSDAPVK
jgi:hypothetical protein